RKLRAVQPVAVVCLVQQLQGNADQGADTDTGRLAALFNPRTQHWSEHFAWSQEGTRILGLTASGRATVEALRLNNPNIVLARRLWVLAGWHPPA
ncbi:MAG: HNH endonuclease, partial [Anaerolineae bacterium]